MGFEDLVKINVLLTDARFVPASREARDRALGSAMPPTSTLSVVTALASPDFLIEIEAIAAKV
jgi:enamine deaminase RidA (YjgF/YER057c/UK114 family)